MCESDIQTPCPQCSKEYSWEACLDVYCGADCVTEVIAGREVNLFLCSCGGVIAVGVNDDFGGDVYEVTQKTL